MNRKKFLIIISLLVICLGAIGVIAEDLIIDSKTQTFSESDNKIKFNGDVKVKFGDIHLLGDKADVSVKNSKLYTATFYDKPYAYEVKNNKKREVKANILKFSLLNKVIKAEGDTQTIITEGKTPVAVINADVQEYDVKANVMTAYGSVSIKYKDINAYTDKAIIHTSSHGDLKRIDLVGRAKIDQSKHHATANHFIYDANNEEMTCFLFNNGINFEYQKTFDNLYGIQNGKLSYDFYIPNHNLLIEYQGKQHEEPIEFFGGEEQFKIQQEHDKRKREYAKNNGYKLLEIWYYDYDKIEEILSRELELD